MNRLTNATKVVDLFASGKHGYGDGVPAVTAATVLDSAAMNPIQEELARAVEQLGGVALLSTSYSQLSDTLQVRAESEALSRIEEIAAPLSGGDFPAAFAVSTAGLGTIVCVGTNGKISSSADGGRTWTARTAGSGFAGNFNSVIWSVAAGLFIAVGDGSVQSSPDGVTWTQRVSSGLQYMVAASSASLIVVIVFDGASTYSTLTSTNGTTYNSHAQAIVLSVATLAVSAGGTFVSPKGTGGAPVYTSADGATWTAHVWGSSSTMLCTSVGYISGSGHFVAVGAAGGTLEMQSSPDGATWTRLRTASSGSGVPVYTDVAAYTILKTTGVDWVCLNGLSPTGLDFKAMQDGADPIQAFTLPWMGRSTIVLFITGGAVACRTYFIS